MKEIMIFANGIEVEGVKILTEDKEEIERAINCVNELWEKHGAHAQAFLRGWAKSFSKEEDIHGFELLTKEAEFYPRQTLDGIRAEYERCTSERYPSEEQRDRAWEAISKFYAQTKEGVIFSGLGMLTTPQTC